MGVESIVICKNGNLGYVASLRFKDSSKDCELAHTDKRKLYSMINYAVRRASNECEQRMDCQGT